MYYFFHVDFLASSLCHTLTRVQYTVDTLNVVIVTFNTNMTTPREVIPI